LHTTVDAEALVADVGTDVGALEWMRPLMVRIRRSVGVAVSEVEAEGDARGGAVGAAGVGRSCGCQ
jgi:hypothetical protein